MEFDLEIGMKKEETVMVTDKNTAIAMESGSLPVFATPALAALWEKAAALLIEKQVSSDWTSVGTLLAIEHIAATPVGMVVTGRAELIEVQGRKLIFSVQAFDGHEEIGRGTHERFLVKKESFMKKAMNKIG
jgi:fluoroacetyl-CoA thioesterase